MHPNGREETCECEELLIPEKTKMLAGLREIKAASENEKKAQELFDAADADGSGELDTDELLELFHGLGIMVDEERVDELVAEVDIDGGGELDFKEFMIFHQNNFVRPLKSVCDLLHNKRTNC